jgi:hypothetical protein
MPKGPRGEKRPADVIGNAILVARIATGEIVEIIPATSDRVRSGKVAGEARVKTLNLKERKSIASAAARARWK